ncbi:MAG: nucleotidyltransferase domain-containing protein [Candidatus Micrarchaeota archaeon]
MPNSLGGKVILKPFFLNPTKPRYIREIAKDCELSYERVQFYLKELEKTGTVRSKVKGKIKEYDINRKNEFILKIFSLLEMERRQKFYYKNPKLQVWLQTVVNELMSNESIKKLVGTTIADIKFILLFGSAARGESKIESDIDVLTVVKNRDENFKKYAENLVKRKMDGLTGKKFSMHLVDLDEFKAKWKKESVYATIWLDHIVLYGEENFWKEILELGEPI